MAVNERWEDAILARRPDRGDDLPATLRVVLTALPVVAGHIVSGAIFWWFWSTTKAINNAGVGMAAAGWYLGGCVEALLFALCLSFFIIWRAKGGHRVQIITLVVSWALGVAAYIWGTVELNQWYDSLGIVDD